jgi:hypothetical protein
MMVDEMENIKVDWRVDLWGGNEVAHWAAQ